MADDTRRLQPLRVALEANAAAYRRAVQSSAPGICWDFAILTAANQKQAEGYRQELAVRHRGVGPTGAFFPNIQRSVVVADPPGRRIGSGGATFGVLAALAEQFDLSARDFARLRILLIHSGGASQRLPMYSPLGKIFAPLPLLRPDGQVATLFDHLYLTLSGLPERLGPGMLVLAGDVFLLFDHRHVTGSPSGVTAITMPVEPRIARGHGVWVLDAQSRIRRTLQKVSPRQMADAGALDAQGRVPIDTGLLFFDGARSTLMAKLAGVDDGRTGRLPAGAPRAIHQRHREQIDLYEQITGALAHDTGARQYIKGALTRELWKRFHGLPFQAMTVQGEFLHLGTTLQFRDAMVGANPAPAAELFQQNILAHSAWSLAPGRRVYQSALLSGAGRAGELGEGAVVEHSLLRGPFSIGAGSVVSQTVALERPVRLPAQRLLFQVPIRREARTLEYAQVLCGVDDDFKTPHHTGACLFLNEPIDAWLQRCGVRPPEIWGELPPDQRTLWNANLFVCTSERDAADVALLVTGSTAPTRAQVARWRRLPRASMATILQSADPQAMIAHREVVTAYLQTAELLAAIDADDERAPAMNINHFTATDAYRAVVRQVDEYTGRPTDDPRQILRQARARATLAQVLRRPNATATAGGPTPRQLTDAAFADVARASETSLETTGQTGGAPAKLTPGREILAAAPVRLDLGGGWSDTPPFCYECGGQVVNLAIDLDGQPPVRATVRTLREPRLLLSSRDLGSELELTDASDLGARAPDPGDPFALHKVALRMVGLVPSSGRIAEHLRRLGAGLSVTTECRVPKGSGLGTSSILAATLLAALHRAGGHRIGRDGLIEQTLVLEQRLSTGGGWQDQVGGIVGGVKSTISPPSIPQRLAVEQLSLTDAQYDALAERLVIYYSGQQRLARDILRRVIERWLVREPAAVALLHELKTSAALLRTNLLRGRWSAAAVQIERYWRIKKDLFPGSTTPAVDVLLLDLRELYLAAGLAGAGGGGFMYFFCRDARQAARLRQSLAERAARPGSLGSVYTTQINRAGLTVRVRARSA